MAKLTKKFEQENQEYVRELNRKEMLGALKQIEACDVIPENIQEFLDTHSIPRVNFVRITSYEMVANQANATFYGEKSKNSCFGCTINRQGQAFPILLMYIPEWSNKAVAKAKLPAVRKHLHTLFQLELSDVLVDIIQNKLPNEVPEHIRFEGSDTRFYNLMNFPGNIVYDNLVVEHRLKGKRAWTFFIPEVDYKAHFVHHIMNVLNIEKDLATQISNSWTHDTYISVQPEVAYDAKKYASDLVFFAEAKEGDFITDLLQGEVEVVSHRGKLYLDIDDELPSAIIIKGRLNVYVPSKSEN